MGIIHPFVSGKVDGADTSLVRPSNWNADHAIAGDVRLPASLEITGPRPWVDVRARGAVGDGVTDDTAAIQAASDAGTHIHFPKPSSFYKITSAISITTAKLFTGGGPGTIIKQTTAGANAFDCNNASASIVGLGFRDLQIQGANVARSAIRCRGANEFNLLFLENVLLNGFDTAFYTESVTDAIFRNVAFEFGHTTDKGVRTGGGRFVFDKCWWEQVAIGSEHIGAAFCRYIEPKWAGGVITRLTLTDNLGNIPAVILDLLESNGGMRFYGSVTTDDAYTARLYSDTQERIIINTSGEIEWGSGAAAVDTNLKRSAVNELKTDDVFRSAAYLVAQDASISGQVAVGRNASGSITWGTVEDTNLYREAANVLATDDKLHVVGETEIDGALNHDGTTVGFYGTVPATQRPANADTSGATLVALETEVNELKQLLRDYGLLAT